MIVGRPKIEEIYQLYQEEYTEIINEGCLGISNPRQYLDCLEQNVDASIEMLEEEEDESATL